MAQFTVTAFKWTGTFYNAEYTTSFKATFEDNDDAYDGSGDADETVSIDGGTPTGTWGLPHSIDVDFTDTDGNDHVETFFFFNTEGDWYFVPKEESAFSEGATLGSYQSHTNGWNYDDVVCFANGTLIEAEDGAMPVEVLRPGSLIKTFGGEVLTLRLNLARHLSSLELRSNPNLCPVCIEAGALGAGLPKDTLRVSRQHRMLITSQIGQRMFRRADVLVAAIRLTSLPGCYVDRRMRPMSYHHLVFDKHAIVFANGAPSESFFPGPQALKSLPRPARAELNALFPHLANGMAQRQSAHFIPEAKQQKQLVARHIKNGKPMLQHQFLST
jgi:hypothetical protein